MNSYTRFSALITVLLAISAQACSPVTDEREPDETLESDLSSTSYPALKLGTSLADYVTQGPVLAAIEYTYGGRRPTDGHLINLTYSGALDCLNDEVNVGIVQKGKVVSKARIRASGRGRGGGGQVSLDGLASGPIEMFFFDQKGNYDSNSGSNYRFTLDLSIIPGHGPHGDIIPPSDAKRIAFAGPYDDPVMQATLSPSNTNPEDRSIILYYTGDLDCSRSLTVGVVQGGTTVVKAPLVNGKAPKYLSNCRADVPIKSLQSGKIEFYFFDADGRFDSNGGANYIMDLDKTL